MTSPSTIQRPLRRARAVSLLAVLTALLSGLLTLGTTAPASAAPALVENIALVTVGKPLRFTPEFDIYNGPDTNGMPVTWRIIDNHLAPWVSQSENNKMLVGAPPHQPTGEGTIQSSDPWVMLLIEQENNQSRQQKVYLPVREPLRISDEPMILTWGRDNGPYTPQADNPWAPPRIRVEGGHVNGFYPGLLTYYSWAPQTPWLGMNENGFLTGTPTDLGTFSIYVSAETYYGDTAGKGTTFEVRPPLMFHANDPDLPDAPVAGLYNQTLSVTGGHDPSGYTWTIEGSLPQGLTLIPNGKTAQIIGVPTTPGTYDFGVKVSNDPEGYEQEVTQSTTLTVTGAGLGLPCPAVIHHQVCDLLN